MSTQPTPPAGGPADGLARLLPYEKQVGYVLVAVGLGLAAIPIYNGYKYHAQSLAVLIWGVMVSLTVIGMGLYHLTPPAGLTDPQVRVERLRWVLLLTAGFVGATTAFLGLVLPFCKVPLALTNYPEIFTGGPKAWRENGWAVGRCVLAMLGGLALMFAGLQLARPVERTSMHMRRWLYGYNAVLSSQLLLFILALVNLLPYTDVRAFGWAKDPIDCTSARMYTLHDATRNLLADLKEPVKVYVLLPAGDPLTREVETLLNNCRAVNPQFTWEELSRDRNRLEVEGLMREYQLTEPSGLLVVYGSGAKPTTQFIKTEELFEEKSVTNRGFDFKGENALVNALSFLSAGKRAVVYFTQGNGELDLNDHNAQQLDTGLGRLQDDLGKINFETHPLNLGLKAASVPEDADIVVVARPREEFPPNAVKALRDYLNGAHRKDGKKGKLMILFDVVLRQGEMMRTGLEGLVAEYGVKVGNNRLMSAVIRNPLILKVIPDPRSTAPVARAFVSPGQPTATFDFYDCRTVESAGAPPGGPYTVDNLVITIPQLFVWTETDLRADPAALANAMRRDQEKLVAKVNERPVPVAVAVTEGKTAAPPIPGHENLGKEGEPRLIVVGDASWVSNQILMGRAGADNFNLFSSGLSWLTGRQDIGQRVPPATRTMYRLQMTGWDTARLLLLPFALMGLGVFALGFGVWVVRRR